MITLSFMACVGTTPVETLEVEVSVDVESHTALTVSWTTEEPADAAIEVGTDAGYGRRVEGWSSADGLEHAVVLAGLGADAPWHWRAISAVAGDVVVSEGAIFEAAAAPADLPELVVTGSYDGLVVGPMHVGESYVAIYRADGLPVWWRKMSTTTVSLTQARMSLDGRAVVLIGTFPELGRDTAIVRLPLAGGEPTIAFVPNGHHDFMERPEGGYAVLARDIRDVAGYEVEGDALVEVSESGEITTIWSSWDLGLHIDPASLPELEGSERREWTHMNSVAYQEGNYWLSSYLLEAVFVVQRDTGALLSTIGGDNSDVRVAGDGEGFGPQHGVLPTDGGFLVFNNRKNEPGDSWAEVVEYELDLRKGEYTRRWSYNADRALFTPVLGNVDPLPEGGHFTAWGLAGNLTILDDSHTPTWEAATPLGSTFAYAHPVAALSGEP